MSSSRWSSDLLIDVCLRWSQPDGVRADLSIARLETAKGHNIDARAEDKGKLRLKVREVEEGTALLELHQEVEITGRSLFASGDRPKKSDGPALVTRCNGLDLVALRLDKGTQRQ